ncbi:methylated-DNA--[protein]-cysteine S-methyltransferase [Desulfovibrio gilichinskyi]|uniref:Methylated-DNA--protein-cysteine methyltransferase n=1 Tax=Desulfovibrio gilichinskyi TaxID=1519643 RepID=A0A1X7CYM8_9BACT|nr:methylated-DNA--[protein]-cysteine S-methyltransferase [Desulfovibrio gilichinskyi]SMF05510.1 methylated-DNA-[protein]-cysteine S-methyltransferase [Desulfovibrio gilichinskyi]
MLYYTTFNSPFWEITMVGNEDGLTNLHMETGKGKRKFIINDEWQCDDIFFEDIKTQVMEYFNRKRKEFDILLNPQGTDFQKKVWQALYAIPFGEVRTYKDIATTIGNPKACRAVGMANSLNPIPIIVPCHRVIGSSGKLTGFASGLNAKEKLLNLEKDT